MGYSWKRPSNIQFPSVWLTFKEKDLNSNDLVEYRVQDLPVDRFEDAIKHMTAVFVADVPMCRSKDLLNDPVSLREVQDGWRLMLEQHVTLVCFKEGSDDIIGMNMICIVSKKECNETHEYAGRALQDVVRAMSILSENFNFFETYKAEEYIMSALGLSVAREYRGRGIGEYILRARVPLGKAIGIKMTNTVFTSMASQILAERAGFELNLEMTYEELAKCDPRCTFPGVKTKSVKVMSLKLI